ncbi:efflux RND transporter periplasmic adaptor subunit [Xenophilus arseniciresistens]|uniref:Efflux RND transporter periplasmic adaptor subunit n=1 Tax=Xenophilus arseniciresistens TaxID=1283306 RepID=A0AAE3NBZ9_9BURK|nr:efflux RND transporter periplasmic adaptor subunit [Xenophilus arseniciresistens]MDA7417537.1 efflux RND transporter periplasmic adaptor subunit [Xenophilus arseniciresistens]
MTSKKRLVLILLAVAVLVLAALAFLKGRGGPEPADKAQSAGGTPAADAARPALTVRVARPTTAQLPITLAANGNVAAWQEASVGSESNGLRLAEVRVNVGDRVKKGQVLALFSPETVNADVAQARASLAEARASAADAAGNAARARTLAQTGAMSQQQINQYQTTEQTARARVEAAEAVLAAQQVRGRNTQVLAPDDGVISSRTATVGSVVGAGTELFKLIRQGRLEWRAEVGSAELGQLSVGLPATVTAPGGGQVQGKLRSIAPTVDPQTRNALVYVDLPGLMQSEGALRAGMFARGEFLIGQSEALTVPQVAVVPRDGFNTVMVLQDDQRVRLTRVQAGRRIGDRIEVKGEQFGPDSQVVVEGAGFLNDGDLVRVAEAAAQPGQPAPSPAPAAPAATPAR